MVFRVASNEIHLRVPRRSIIDMIVIVNINVNVTVNLTVNLDKPPEPQSQDWFRSQGRPQSRFWSWEFHFTFNRDFPFGFFALAFCSPAPTWYKTEPHHKLIKHHNWKERAPEPIVHFISARFGPLLFFYTTKLHQHVSSSEPSSTRTSRLYHAGH